MSIPQSAESIAGSGHWKE